MICLTCGYETDDKSNYNKHLMTNKHMWYLTNNTEEKVQNLVENNGYYKCPHCKYLTQRNDNLKRHITTKHKSEENIIDISDENIESESDNDIKENLKETKNEFKGNKSIKKKKNLINLS